MILHRLEWHDPHQGRCYEWYATKSAAHRRRRELHAEAPGPDYSVSKVEIPPRKAALADWLSENFDRDNG